MTHRYPLAHIDEIPAATSPARGWPRVAIGGADGSATAAWHAVYPPGSGHGRHVHHDCDVITYCLSGRGVVGHNGEIAGFRPGHCRLAPRGTEQFLVNESPDEDAVFVGFCIGAADLDSTGYEFLGEVADLESPRGALSQGVMVHLDDVAPEVMDTGDGWSISDFRLPIGRHNGSASTLFRARFLPGAVHKKHRHDRCDEIYYVIAGRGVAGAGPDRVEVRGGHFHYIPRGVEHWLSNLGDGEPIEVVGIYVDAGDVAETGYVYLGEVGQEDLG